MGTVTAMGHAEVCFGEHEGRLVVVSREWLEEFALRVDAITGVQSSDSWADVYARFSPEVLEDAIGDVLDGGWWVQFPDAERDRKPNEFPDLEHVRTYLDTGEADYPLNAEGVDPGLPDEVAELGHVDDSGGYGFMGFDVVWWRVADLERIRQICTEHDIALTDESARIAALL